MTLTLRPELEQFIDEQVKAGHYPTREAVVEAALTGLADGPTDESLDAEDLAAIAESDAEFDRGEIIALDDLKAEYRKRFGIHL